jgi:hypothetical protein
MGPEDESKSAPEQTERTDSSIPRPRGRRSGRGRRGRGRRPQRPVGDNQPRPASSLPLASQDTPSGSTHAPFEDAQTEPAQTRDLDAAIQSEDAPEFDSQPGLESDPAIEAEPGVWEAAEPAIEPRAGPVPPPFREAQTPALPPVPRPAPVEKPPFTPPENYTRQPASPQTVQKAIVEVNQIIRTLQESLDGMEEVLETLELAERQKDADEHEIESLRRTLRQFQRPRESGHRH